MRLPLAALTVALVAAIGFVPLPAIGAVEPGCALSCGSATAGADVPCTISRATSGKGLYVLFETADGTAHAGTDYTAVRQLLYFKPSALTQTVAVHTALNPSAAGTLTFNAAIAASTLVVRSTGSIIEPAPPPIASAWVPAPLRDGGFARVVTVSDPLWETEKATGQVDRSLQVGEVVAVYFNGAAINFDGSIDLSVYAISDGAAGRVKAVDVEGVAPAGNPPLPPPNMNLPADWWVPGLVIANKTCANANDPAQPGVTQGGVYRASMLAGTHMQLASGQVGSSGSQWIVFAADDPWQGAREVVTGDCLTGQ